MRSEPRKGRGQGEQKSGSSGVGIRPATAVKACVLFSKGSGTDQGSETGKK